LTFFKFTPVAIETAKASMARATAMAKIFINSTIILKCYIKLDKRFLKQYPAFDPSLRPNDPFTLLNKVAKNGSTRTPETKSDNGV
jgi:hypothetical protein